jgi:hypothetical protein
VFPAPGILPAAPEVAVIAHAGLLAAAGDVAAFPIVDGTAGSVGIEEPSPRVPAVGNTPGSGTAGVELIPRLPIS